MKPTFLGNVRSGKLFLDKPDQFKQHLATFPDEKRVEVTVEKLRHPRSNQQNKYYWSCVVKTIADHTGHDPEQVHELLKQMFSPKWHMSWMTTPDMKVGEPYMKELQPEHHDIAVPTSTTCLDTIAFVDYTEKCRLWANEFLGLNIPLPGEVTV